MPYESNSKQREYQRQWMQDKRAKYFEGKKCKKCESTLNLELHHLDPSKKESHRIWSWRQDKLEAEMSKCIILCRECHQLEHGKHQEEALLQMIRDFHKEHGRLPVLNAKELPAANSTFRRYFGTWNAAIIKAGFEPRTSSKKKK